MAEQGIRTKDPVRPGAFIRREVNEEHGLSVGQTAAAIGVNRPTLSVLLNERGSLSPHMALGIGKAFGASMGTLMHMQCAYDIAQVRSRANDISVAPRAEDAEGREAGEPAVTVIPVNFRPGTAIVTKRKTYILPPDAIGAPIEEYWPDRDIPKSLNGCNVWQTEDGPVIGRPERDA